MLINRTKKIVLTALLTALTAIGAQIVIPIGTVPVTLQIFVVFLSGMILGPIWGFISQAAYLMLGAIGLPVFAQFAGGLGIIAGPTGGFLLAFPFAAMIAGFAREKGRKISVVIILTSLAVVYLVGWLRLSLFFDDFQKGFMAGVLPFIGFDFLKLWGAYAVYIGLKKRILLPE
ncbi:MAG TPA: biotin transporter BioY [Thermotogota bacterium]|nr:biotin transporter BioY [Thermotogota bacterium]